MTPAADFTGSSGSVEGFSRPRRAARVRGGPNPGLDRASVVLWSALEGVTPTPSGPRGFRLVSFAGNRQKNSGAVV